MSSRNAIWGSAEHTPSKTWWWSLALDCVLCASCAKKPTGVGLETHPLNKEMHLSMKRKRNVSHSRQTLNFSLSGVRKKAASEASIASSSSRSKERKHGHPSKGIKWFSKNLGFSEASFLRAFFPWKSVSFICSWPCGFWKHNLLSFLWREWLSVLKSCLLRQCEKGSHESLNSAVTFRL